MSDRSAFALLLILLWMLLPADLRADDFKLIPSLAVRQEYNDNIFFTADDATDDFITTISGSLELSERTERLDLNLLAVVSPFFYAQNSNLDDVDQNDEGTVRYQLTELLGINADALYNVSYRPDRDIETTGLVESNDKRTRQAFGGGINYTLTETAGAAFSYDYLQDDWSERRPEREDLKSHSLSLNYTHNVSQWWDSTNGLLSFGVGRYKFETSDTYSSFGAVGAEHRFSETLKLGFDVGLRYGDSDFDRPEPVSVTPSSTEIRIVKDNNKGFGAIGQAELEIRGEITRSSLKISHDLQPASGRGGTVVRSDIRLNWSRRFAERSVIAVSTGFYKNKADRDQFSFREIDVDTYFIQPRVRWEFFDNFILEGGYNFAYVDNHVENADKMRNLVYLQVAYGIPLFE